MRSGQTGPELCVQLTPAKATGTVACKRFFVGLKQSCVLTRPGFIARFGLNPLEKGNA